MDGACGNNNEGRLSLQWIMAVVLAWVEPPSVVQHRKTTHATTLVC
jgi:hypothetical protein